MSRYASAEKKIPGRAPRFERPTTLAPQGVHQAGTPEPCKPSILALLGQVMGRKNLAHELEWTDSYLDKVIQGEKRSPFIPVNRIIYLTLKHLGRNEADILAQDLVAEINGVVLDRELVQRLIEAVK